MAKAAERLHSVLATLDGCRAVLVDNAEQDTAQILSVAMLQLRQKLNQISDAELRAFCDAIAPDDRPAGKPHDPKSPQGHRSAVLKLVK